MSFWQEVLAGFLGNIFAGFLLVALYVAIQWFLSATDLIIQYNWKFDGTVEAPRNIRPHFQIRNRSRSKTYYLANIAYLKDKRPAASFDNKSIWAKELKPGTIEFVEGGPIISIHSLNEALGFNVHVRLQNGRNFWLKGQGPGQLRMGIIQRFSFWLRKIFDLGAIPLE
jgi:hypothetical protein